MRRSLINVPAWLLHVPTSFSLCGRPESTGRPFTKDSGRPRSASLRQGAYSAVPCLLRRPSDRLRRPVAGSATLRPKEGSSACLPPSVDLEATPPGAARLAGSVASKSTPGGRQAPDPSFGLRFADPATGRLRRSTGRLRCARDGSVAHPGSVPLHGTTRILICTAGGAKGKV